MEIDGNKIILQSLPTMNSLHHLSRVLFVASIGISASGGMAQDISDAKPYMIVNSTQIMGNGGTDYLYADNDDRQLYIPRGNQVLVFDLDTLKSPAPSPTRGRTESPLTRNHTTVFAAAAPS